MIDQQLFFFLLHYTVSKYIVIVISQKVLLPPSKLKLVTQKIKSELGEKKKKNSRKCLH